MACGTKENLDLFLVIRGRQKRRPDSTHSLSLLPRQVRVLCILGGLIFLYFRLSQYHDTLSLSTVGIKPLTLEGPYNLYGLAIETQNRLFIVIYFHFVLFLSPAMNLMSVEWYQIWLLSTAALHHNASTQSAEISAESGSVPEGEKIIKSFCSGLQLP